MTDSTRDDGRRWPGHVFAGLPDAFRALLPEIDDLPWHEEVRADCSNCVMAPAVCGDGLDTPWAFHPEGRCCTFQPGLANFLAGRALRRGGRAAELITAQVARSSGASAWGILPTSAWREQYHASAQDRFGRDLSIRCHYWVGGDHACGIWYERPSTCRTWFCKHDHGLHGAALWAQLQRLLACCESILADFCIAQGEPPSSETAGVERWLDWYRECAGRVDGITADELVALVESSSGRADGLVERAPDGVHADSGQAHRMAIALREGRDDLVVLHRRLPGGAVPEVLVPSVEGTWPHPRGVRVSGYSRYDTVIAPASFFIFLANLDGERSWKDARDEMLSEGHEPPSDELIAELHRIGAIEPPGSSNPTVLRSRPFPLVRDPVGMAPEDLARDSWPDDNSSR